MTDDDFYAWLDGELDGDAAASMAARVAADPALAALAAQHRGLEDNLRGAFAPVIVADVAPPRMTADVVDLAARRAPRASGFGLPQWAAMAATLVVGVLIGTTLIGERGGSPVAVRGGAMVATAGLDRALDQQYASGGDVAGLRIGVTFRDSAGAICRSFTDQRSSGLACRAGNDWRVKGLFAAPQAPGGDYRMAAGADPNLAALIDSTIAGEAFDAAQEKSAQARGWR